MNSGAALPFRVTSLEKNEMQTAAELRALDSRATKTEAQLVALTDVVAALKDETQTQNGKLDKLMWTLVGLSVTIAGSAVTIAMTIGGHP